MTRQERRALDREARKPRNLQKLRAMAEDKANGFPWLRAIKAAHEYQPRHTDPLAKAVSR